MIRCVVALMLVALLPLPAAAADPATTLLPPVGQRVHYRVMRTVQSTSTPQVSATLFDLVRRTDTTIVLERHDASGGPNLSVLKIGPDGLLALSEDARGAAADADLTDLLFGLNAALAATHGADAAARTGWTATVPVGPARGAAVALMIVVPTIPAGGEFDFSGTGDAAASTTTSAPSAPPGRSGGRGRSS